MNEPIIEFSNFGFQYNAQSEPTLYDINLKIRKGEKVLILPPHIKPINTRRKLEQLRDDLGRYHVATWGQQGLRGFAISTKLKEVELAHMIATNGPKSKAQLAKERKDNVRAKLKELQGLSD